VSRDIELTDILSLFIIPSMLQTYKEEKKESFPSEWVKTFNMNVILMKCCMHDMITSINPSIHLFNGGLLIHKRLLQNHIIYPENSLFLLLLLPLLLLGLSFTFCKTFFSSGLKIWLFILIYTQSTMIFLCR